MELSLATTKERIEELRRQRAVLPENVYRQRKENIASKLRRLLLGSVGRIEVAKESTSVEVVTGLKEICRALTAYWQRVFAYKPTDSSLRRLWLNRLSAR